MHAAELLKIIESLKKNDIDSFVLLDSNGILAAPDENVISFRKRTREILSGIVKFEKQLEEQGDIRLFDSITVKKERRIPDEVLREASEINDRAYKFHIAWIPGFFISESLGLFWGGCAISSHENDLSLFLIRANFAKKRRWLFYRRDELLSHELSHIARVPINDRTFEEHFAYALSPSRLRRYMGNCFQRTYDAAFFILPFFLLLAAQTAQLVFSLEKMPIYPFWLLIAVYPAYLLVRNQKSRNIISRARKNLVNAGIAEPEPVLFRCTRDEISAISAFSNDILGLQEWLGKRANSRLRWRIIYERFLKR